MSVRNILDYQDNVIGQMELPDETTEDQWTEALSPYAKIPTSVPKPNISARQIRLALIGAGLSLSDIDTALNSLPEPTKSYAQVEWQYASEFERDNELVANVGLMLGWGSTELDALWDIAYGL